jgi:hypothetical protein
MPEGEDPFESYDVSLNRIGEPDGCIFLDGDYPIALEKCDTSEKILGWIEPLGDRPRFQPLLRIFVLTAARYHNIQIGYGM